MALEIQAVNAVSNASVSQLRPFTASPPANLQWDLLLVFSQNLEMLTACTVLLQFLTALNIHDVFMVSVTHELHQKCPVQFPKGWDFYKRDSFRLRQAQNAFNVQHVHKNRSNLL